jgi:hypothetical protein
MLPKACMRERLQYICIVKMEKKEWGKEMNEKED